MEINENLYIEKKLEEGHLYINGIRAKALPGGKYYQMIEPELFKQFDEICRLFNDNTEIDVDKETYLPVSIRINGKSILTIEFETNSVKIVTKLSLNEIRNIRTKFEKTFGNIFSLLKEVNLYG
jgi:hypothetical protein